MSLGETLLKALMDTLMGMGTVFIILILICLIISLFKFIRQKEDTAPAADNAVAELTSSDEEDESEIMAVIMAALRMAMAGEAAQGNAAFEGEAPVYTVRSVRRRR